MGAEDRSEYNNYNDGENIIVTSVDAANISIYATTNNGSTAEDDHTFVLNKGSLGTGFTLRPSAACQIISIGSKTFRNPITVSTAGFSWHKHLRDFNSIVIKPSAAGVMIELLVT